MNAPRATALLGAAGCLAAGGLGWVAWRALGLPALLAGAGLATVCALAALTARRLPMGPSKYEQVSGLERAALACALAGSAFFALVGLDALVQIAAETLRLIGHPFASNLLDGREPSKAWLLLHGRTIYPPLDGNQLLVTLYNPLYHLVLAGLFTLDQHLFAVARVLNALLAAGLLAMVWRLGSLRGGVLAAAAAALVLAVSEPFSFARFTRPDMLAWTLAFAGLLAVHAAIPPEEPSRKRNVARAAHAAGALLALAYLTKQQSMPFALGTALFLAVERRWGLLARTGGAFVLAAGGGLLAEALATGSDVFAHTLAYPRLIAANPEITSLARGASGVLAFLAANAGLCLAWLAFAPARWRARRLELEEAVFLANLPFLAVLLGTWGADANYPLSALALLCVLAARGMARALEKGPAWAALCAAALLTLLPGQTAPGLQRDSRAASLAWREAVVRAVADAPGPVLADVEGAPAFLADADPDKMVLYDAVELAAHAWASGRTLAGSPLLEDLARKRFALVVNSPTLHAREYTLALHRHYTQSAALGPFELYRPRSADAVLELRGMTPPGAPGPSEAGFAARLEPGANLRRVEGRDCWCADDRRAPGEALLRLDAPPIASTFEAGVYLMKSGESGSAAADLLLPGGKELPVPGLGALKRLSFDEVWNAPTLLHGTWPGGPAAVRLRLEGTATLCVSTVDPAWAVLDRAAKP
ncbi:hypothetical protein NNJEOMEG_02559 [Fundidesulfovibrio magnetotacticus]|uniref:Glycosyltransferase RgtA/B/C/D-like domain-containing protein n=1 Tax=Fundidesulfovibrio magnetotacticus TaxID=2730080 RepID=A0A6V8LQA1_9BACT|nr:hypothetical protein [Fundidesulfovibrio magnetotacticus]GFK94712.1 hypothetical protein NNJEOMEG_02559 [Fundidesulfovibrio magnetotacticus]